MQGVSWTFGKEKCLMVEHLPIFPNCTQTVYQTNVTKRAIRTCVKERMIVLGPKGEVDDGYLPSTRGHFMRVGFLEQSPDLGLDWLIRILKEEFRTDYEILHRVSYNAASP